MKPIFTEVQFTSGQQLCGKLMTSFRETKDLEVQSALVAVATAAVVTSDLCHVPLESLFQFMRDLRRGFQMMQQELTDKRAKGELPSVESGLVVPNAAPSIIVAK